MSAKSSKNVKICITKGAATGTNLVLAGLTVGNPTIIEVGGGVTVKSGEVIRVPAGATGYSEVDGKDFIAGKITPSGSGTGQDVELLGCDTSASTGAWNPAAGGAVADIFQDSDMECLCLANLGFNPETPDTIATGTFCDPSASIPSATTAAGTLNFGGYVDINDTDYRELLAAEFDGKERFWRITLPNNGYIVFPATIASFSWQVPLEGAVAYEGTAVLGSKPRHLFTITP